MRTRHVVALYTTAWLLIFGLLAVVSPLLRLGPNTDLYFNMASAASAIIAALVVLRAERHLTRPHL